MKKKEKIKKGVEKEKMKRRSVKGLVAWGE